MIVPYLPLMDCCFDTRLCVSLLLASRSCNLLWANRNRVDGGHILAGEVANNRFVPKPRDASCELYKHASRMGTAESSVGPAAQTCYLGTEWKPGTGISTRMKGRGFIRDSYSGTNWDGTGSCGFGAMKLGANDSPGVGGDVLRSAFSTVRDSGARPDLPVGEQLSALVFDLDGTLYLQGPLRRALFWRLLRAGMIYPASTWRHLRIIYHYRRAQEYLRTCPEPFAETQVRLACDWSGARQEEVLDAVSRWMEDAPLEVLERCLRPGLVELLDAAETKGIHLGLLSDYPAKKKLAAMRLDPYFSTVVCAQDVRVGLFKPSPNGLAVLLQDLGVDPAKTVYVGDRASVDGTTAWRAGVAGVILGKPFGSSGRGWVGVPDIPSLRALLQI